jgi:hypothetical protein
MSPSVKTAFGVARAVTPDGMPVPSTAVLLGIIRAHSGYSEPEVLLAHLGLKVDDLLSGLWVTTQGLDPNAPRRAGLRRLPELTEDCGEVVRAASGLASAYDPYRDGKMHVPHLFGGILKSGHNTEARRTLELVVGEAAIAKASDEYDAYLRELMRNTSSRYEDFLSAHPLGTASSLPDPPEPFIGRRAELKEINTSLRTGAVVFITGPRGSGKTALALRAASDFVTAFPAGVTYINGRVQGARNAELARHAESTLVIVDDAEGLDVGALIDGLPMPVIVTTTAAAPTSVGSARARPILPITLGPLTPEDAQELLEVEGLGDVASDVAALAAMGGVIGGIATLGGLVSSGVAAWNLLEEMNTLVSWVDPTGSDLDMSRGRIAEAEWRVLVERLSGRAPHEQQLFRALGVLDSPFSTAQAARASEADEHIADTVLRDLSSAGLVEETDDGRWSLSDTSRTLSRSRLSELPDTERARVLMQVLAARHSLGLTSEPPSLAGFRSDQPSEVDYIGFEPDVDALCSVLIAHQVKPPISVGLFGEWGTGKSTFMRLMRDRIRALQGDWSGRDDSPFCKGVKQITFNAWSYSDANLWASLVTTIFDGLAGSDPEVQGDAPLRDPERAAIVASLQTAQATIAEKQAQLDEANSRQGELQARLEAIKRNEAEAGARLGAIRPAELILKARESKKIIALGDEVLKQTNNSGAPQGEAVRTARELQSTWGFVVHAARLLGSRRVAGLVAITIVLLAAVGVAESSGIPIAGTLAAVAGWLGALAAVVHKPVAKIRRAAEAADDLLTGLREEEQATVRREEAAILRELSQFAGQRAQLEVELEEARSAAARADRAIADIQSGRRITQFVEERAASAEYRQYLGLIALIRRDFDELTRLLLGAETADKPPFDRVILYIDDLDRCRAPLVVQVLEAVHLLLALKLFVVVVGVDPRWLAQSLKQHYLGQLGLRDGDDVDPEAESWATTPQNYLEKIFQIPFVLRPMGKQGFQRMMGELFELRQVEGTGVSGVSEPRQVVEPTQDDALATATERPRTGSPSPPTRSRERTLELLRIWPKELEYLEGLGGLVPTPRAATRLANTYRLIRVNQDGPNLSRFVSQEGAEGEYRAALVLLTVVVGFSEIADNVFRSILESTESTFQPFVTGLLCPPDVTPHEADAYDRLKLALEHLLRSQSIPEDLAVYRRWVPQVARYSFETARIPLEEPATTR